MKFERGQILVSTKKCPYQPRGGIYRVSRIVSDNLMELFILEHPKEEYEGSMFKARPDFFELKDKVDEEKEEKPKSKDKKK